MHNLFLRFTIATPFHVQLMNYWIYTLAWESLVATIKYTIPCFPQKKSINFLFIYLSKDTVSYIKDEDSYYVPQLQRRNETKLIFFYVIWFFFPFLLHNVHNQHQHFSISFGETRRFFAFFASKSRNQRKSGQK